MMRLAFVLTMLAAPLFAEDACAPGEYTYKVHVDRPAYDGDTVALRVRPGFGIEMDLGNVRLFGIDAIELRDPGGIEARDHLRSLLPDDWFWANSIKDEKGKFGRYLFRLCPNGLDVSAAMVAAGHAVWKEY